MANLLVIREDGSMRYQREEVVFTAISDITSFLLIQAKKKVWVSKERVNVTWFDKTGVLKLTLDVPDGFISDGVSFASVLSPLTTFAGAKGEGPVDLSQGVFPLLGHLHDFGYVARVDKSTIDTLFSHTISSHLASHLSNDTFTRSAIRMAIKFAFASSLSSQMYESDEVELNFLKFLRDREGD